MNIKSLLIGSAAALAAVSGAQAADAIVAAEPEPLEYVRVCDAFGTGTSDWDSFTRTQFNIDTKTDTEVGAVRGFIEFRGDADYDGASALNIQQAFIELGGLKVGKFYSWWDDSLSGETDYLNTQALFNSIRYVYDAGSFWAGVSVDELEGFGGLTRSGNVLVVPTAFPGSEPENNVGIAAGVGAKLAGVTLQLIGGYDVDREEGAVRLIGTADIGPGTLGLAGIYASGGSAYFNRSEWVVAAEYAIKATDKLTITPAAQYFGNVADAARTNGPALAITNGTAISANSTTVRRGDEWSSRDAWTAGVTVDYKITDGLSTKVTANYYDEDGRGDQVTGFVRLQRNF
ncbi:porin [Rhizobium sp. Leaf262]|uniref:porin n=1 Tax=Rhizobium sp. Leaf262 TaxID=1736312 RepID=UPI000712DC20|nr:porin [Rhizobium sp. Leaf262]KQO75300.1 hypothetical protein ASF29_12875 [Rhizobium sp. Leaf262]